MMSNFDWQPIETAPKDGTYIIGARWDREWRDIGKYAFDARWSKEWLEDERGGEVKLTHWLHLPGGPPTENNLRPAPNSPSFSHGRTRMVETAPKRTTLVAAVPRTPIVKRKVSRVFESA